MPFADFRQTLTCATGDGGSDVSLRLEYRAGGAGRLLEPFVLRPRLTKAVRRSVANISRRFA